MKPADAAGKDMAKGTFGVRSPEESRTFLLTSSYQWTVAGYLHIPAIPRVPLSSLMVSVL